MIETKDLITNWLNSWLNWRNRYTDKGEKSFNMLRDFFGTTDIPTAGMFLAKYNGTCPICRNGNILSDAEYGVIECLCQLLSEMDVWKIDYENLRTKVEDLYLNEIVFNKNMGNVYPREMNKAVTLAEDFIRKPNHWLVICGALGLGKTMLLRAINTAFYPASIYVSAGDLEQYTHKFRREDSMDHMFEGYRKVPILIIDDVGAEHGGEFITSTLEKIMDSRYAQYPLGPTVIASNKYKFDLTSRVSRSMDRIFDEGRARVLEFSSQTSYRGLSMEER